MDHKASPLENVFNILSGLPQGHDKPVKQALYNTIALFVLIICCGAGWALYLILNPFIKPLIWALLVGSVLHPFKYSLARRFKSWFNSLDESSTPIIIGLFFIPVNIINDISEIIGSRLLQYMRGIIAFCIIIPLAHILYFYTPSLLIQCIWFVVYYVNTIINFCITNTSVIFIIMLLVGYATLMVVFWTPGNNRKFHYASMVVWLMVSCFVAKQFGSIQFPIFITLQFVLLGGFISEVMDISKELNHSNKGTSTLADALKYAIQGKETSEIHKAATEPHLSGHNTKNVIINEPTEPLVAPISAVDSDSSSIVDSTVKIQEIPSKTYSTKASPSKTSAKISPKANKKIKDPFTLDLFEKKTNASLIITDQGKVHLIKESAPNELPLPPLKVRRSLSQPYISHKHPRLGLLSWRKHSSKMLRTSNDESSSDFYIYTLLWFCGVMLFWKNIMLLPILPIPILIYIVKHLGNYVGLWSCLFIYWNKGWNAAYVWCEDRYDALVPVPIRGLYRIVYKINLWMKHQVKDSIDTVASCVVISALIIFVTIGSIFIVIQVYAEAIMLIQMSSNVINQTIVHNPELRQLLPPTFESTVDSLFDNAYLYGREGISKAVRSMMVNVDPLKSAKLEAQVLELWDRIYQTWMSSDTEDGPKVTSEAVTSSWNHFINDLQKSPEMFNLSGIMSFVNQNVGTLMSLLESVWAIVKGNISLVIGSFSAILSILLGGGTAVLNFIIDMIIFLTTLFYLLSSSGNLYKPVELMTQFSTSGSRFGLALGDAINGVFTASFKMAAFYGLWTWFIHNLFGVKIVYLPSAFAAILGAAPFLGTYWACVPAVLDLWLAQGKSFMAILMAIFQILPMSVVDATIYTEMKGGHPYLTGLAIAGGIFCIGIEGAIIGPLVLCGLYVAMDLSTTLFRDSPSEESLNIRELSRLDSQN